MLFIFLGIVLWFLGFTFAGNVYFIVHKQDSYNSLKETWTMVFLWWIFLTIVVVGSFGKAFGRFLLFIEGTK